MKRAIDILVAGFGLLVLSPLVAVLAAAVRIDSPGPVIYRQCRVGRHDSRFEILKFRSMRIEPDGHAPQVTSAGDPRITRVGRVLRSSKLDELPQLCNVFWGEMSLVGPRPEVERYADLWPAEARRLILSVRPGITDPAAVEFRHEAELLATYDDPEKAYREVVLPRKVQIYVDYVNNRAWYTDINVILRTIGAVLGRRAPAQ